MGGHNKFPNYHSCGIFWPSCAMYCGVTFWLSWGYDSLKLNTYMRDITWIQRCGRIFSDEKKIWPFGILAKSHPDSHLASSMALLSVKYITHWAFREISEMLLQILRSILWRNWKLIFAQCRKNSILSLDLQLPGHNFAMLDAGILSAGIFLSMSKAKKTRFKAWKASKQKKMIWQHIEREMEYNKSQAILVHGRKFSNLTMIWQAVQFM